ncbi:MAG: hypothetical protein ACNA7Z_03025 [Dethiobacteria bacterium]
MVITEPTTVMILGVLKGDTWRIARPRKNKGAEKRKQPGSIDHYTAEFVRFLDPAVHHESTALLLSGTIPIGILLFD